LTRADLHYAASAGPIFHLHFEDEEDSPAARPSHNRNNSDIFMPHVRRRLRTKF